MQLMEFSWYHLLKRKRFEMQLEIPTTSMNYFHTPRHGESRGTKSKQPTEYPPSSVAVACDANAIWIMKN